MLYDNTLPAILGIIKNVEKIEKYYTDKGYEIIPSKNVYIKVYQDIKYLCTKALEEAKCEN